MTHAAATASPTAPGPDTLPWYLRPAPENVKHISSVQELVDALVGGAGRCCAGGGGGGRGAGMPIARGGWQAAGRQTACTFFKCHNKRVRTRAPAHWFHFVFSVLRRPSTGSSW